MKDKCLVVEVDQHWVGYLRGALAQLGVEVKAVSRDVEALEEIDTGAYQLITLDLSMDVEHRFSWGKHLLAALRARKIRVPPIIVVSGSTEFNDLVACINDYRDLVCYFAPKAPWDAAKFCDAVTRVLTQRKHAPRTPSAPSVEPRAFLAHGGGTEALNKLSVFLEKLGVKPLIVEWLPSEGRSVNTNVEYYLAQADCGIVLATRDDLVDGKFQPRGNVNIELGRFQERFPGKVIYLLEEGASFPSNVSEKVWERFTQDNMERAFVKVVTELKAFELI
jgi:CheY-like chemotaxis protein